MAVIMVLPFFISPFLRGPSKPNLVRPDFSSGYVGVLALLAALAFGALGLLGHIWQRGWSQITPWSLLVLGFAVPGIGFLTWSMKRKLLITDAGIEVHAILRSARYIVWSEIRSIEYRRRWQSIRIIVGNGAHCGLSVYYTNLGALLKAADDRGIPLVGFPKAPA
jgi:hypothetical protein